MDPMKAQQLAAELEVEMMADMYNRMTNACHRKCVPPHYKEAELSKGRGDDEECNHWHWVDLPGLSKSDKVRPGVDCRRDRKRTNMFQTPK
ncbi:hypothetical protein AMELA_G00053920 [Ameiurus melas]|uniref:Mitochondrial import inner membrane translocase subunit n=1 Tax=Ameiurus melas TaxID=219545 RepID=A0A7J6B6K4_AMEME|nr:hypothetical protein AMELA_G00053920 [Ameiurus melas]